jgi:hypothetical protein
MPSRRAQILGWVLFIFSAIGFIVSSIRLGDIAGVFGGVLFLLGCLAFLLPMFANKG